MSGMDEAFNTARSAHRGPVFVDVPMDAIYGSAGGSVPTGPSPVRHTPDEDALRAIAELLGAAVRPVLVLGTDVWADGAEDAALRFVEAVGLPTLTNGMGRGILPGGHPLLVTKARRAAFGRADLVVVVGTPLDFRLGYGEFGGKDGATPAQVVHVADAPSHVSTHAHLAASAAGDLTQCFDGLHAAFDRLARRPDWSAWATELRRRRGRRERARRPAAVRRGRPDPPGPDLRRAAPPARRRRRGHRRRRGLRVLRRQARRATPARRLAGPRDRTAAWAPAWAGRSRPAWPGRRHRWCCCSATVPRASR